jgi:hypothetical protein
MNTTQTQIGSEGQRPQNGAKAYKFTVHVYGAPSVEKSSVEEAIRFAQQQVYLGGIQLHRAHELLSAGKEFSYSYGFSSVQIKPSQDAVLSI